MKDISVVIPVYNSSENLDELYKQLKDALQSIAYEIIFVDDCSSDNSWGEICRMAQIDSTITAVGLRKNSGQDNALMAGFSYAEGNYICIMDDDLQHSPYDIPALYEQCRKGYDVCYAGFSRKEQKLWKNTGSWLNGVFAQFLLKKPKGIYMSPFKMVKRDVIQEVIQYTGPFPYIDGLLLQLTNSLTSVKVQHHKRFKGKGNFNFIRSVSLFLKIMTSFSVIPLRLATITGFVTSFIGFLLAVYYMFEYFLNQHRVEGWASLIISLLIIGGLLLMSMGLIGEYIGRIFITLNGKPQYSVRKVIRTGSDH